MTLELRDRLPKVEAEAPAPAADGDGPRGDVASALVNLGYQRPAIDKALEAVVKDTPGLGFEDLLRRALRHLSR
jgi:Holliday junction DNA helicase RuvA